MKVTPEDASAISCFSCKSKKAREEKAKSSSDSGVKVSSASPNTTTGKTSTAPVELKIENTTTTSPVNPIDSSLFQGLDNNVIIKSADQPSSMQLSGGSGEAIVVEIKEASPTATTSDNETLLSLTKPAVVSTSEEDDSMKKDENTSADLPRVDSFKKEVEVEFEQKTTTTSMIDSTSLDTAATTPLVAAQLTVEPPKVENVNITIGKPSDDVIKLPELKEREIFVTAPVVNLDIGGGAKKSEKIPAETAPEKTKKKKSATNKNKKPVSCFSSKKKNTAEIDVKKRPTSKPAATEIPINTEIKINLESSKPKTAAAVTSPVVYDVVLPPSDWSIGLDRSADVALIKREPENYEIKIVEEVKTKVDEKKPEAIPVIELPSVIATEVIHVPKTTETSKSPSGVKLTIDSPGAYIKLDREPDHAVIPIVVSTTPTVSSIKVEKSTIVSPAAEAALVVDKKDEKKEKKRSKKSSKKTSAIDLPLINILVPKTTSSGDDSEHKKKQKKEKKPKAKKEKTEVRIENITVLLSIDNI